MSSSFSSTLGAQEAAPEVVELVVVVVVVVDVHQEATKYKSGNKCAISKRASTKGGSSRSSVVVSL